jgi:hypothetical protein
MNSLRQRMTEDVQVHNLSLGTPCSRASKSVDGSSPCDHLAPVWDAFRDQVLLPRFQTNALPLDEQGVTTLRNNHILIVVMNMFG